MKTERDKFLTEAVGECWHKWKPTEQEQGFVCTACGALWDYTKDKTEFSTWDGFGKLWEWAQRQPLGWRIDFFYRDHGIHETGDNPAVLIHPDRFADAVYEFLKSTK